MTVSIYCATGIYAAIGALIYGLYRREGHADIPRWSGWGLYALSRVVPLLMQVERSGSTWLNIILDLAMFLLLDGLTAVADRRFQGRGSILYTLNPVVILGILSGQVWIMAVICLLTLVLLLLSWWAQRVIADFSAMECYLEYVCMTCSVFYGWIAVEHYGKSPLELLKGTEPVPVLLLLAVAGGLLSVICCLRKLLNWKNYPRRFSVERTPAEAVRPPVPEGKLTKRDAVWMVLLTVFFAMVAFRGLGSLDVPETNFHLQQPDTHEIVLNLGEEVSVDRLDIFLGHQNNRLISVSYAEPGEWGWQLLHSKTNIKSPYAWNQLEMDVTTRYIGIVAMSESMDLLELVILDENGEQVIPVNAAEYEALFDEQELYPEYATYYYRMVFDELHHGRTAYDFVHGLYPTETTHPPLAKVLIGLGIHLFGMNPFGWRCVSALFGVLMVPLVYLFAWRFSRKTSIAATAAVLLCTEFMHLTLSRQATLDTIAGFFILLMFYLMYCFTDTLERGEAPNRKYSTLFLCGCAMGCAIASKWTGGYAVAGIAVLFSLHLLAYCQRRNWERSLRRELVRLCAVCVLSFIVVPCVIYVLSYIPFAQADQNRNLLQTVIGNSVFMLTYHSDAVFEHPYTSEWYTWLIDQRSLLDAFNSTGEGVVSTISTLGNPLIVWGGLAALVHHFYLWLCKRNRTARFLTIAYLSMLIPWWFIHRTVFIYHYFGCILFLTLMLTYSVSQLKGKQNRNLALLAAGSLALFVMFYPVLTGAEVSRTYVETFLEWFDTWIFV